MTKAEMEVEIKEPSKRQLQYDPKELNNSYQFLARYQVDTEEMDDDDVVEMCREIQAYKEENVQVLSRGRVLDGIDRLLAFVPDNFVGEFKRELDTDIARAKALGWEIFYSKDAMKASETGTGTDKVRLGDQVLMIMPRTQYIASLAAKDSRNVNRRAQRNPKVAAQTETQGFDNPIKPM